MAKTQQQADRAAAAAAAIAARKIAAQDARSGAKATTATQVEALIIAQGLTRDRLSNQGVKKVSALVRAFHRWYDSDAITKMAAEAVKDIEDVQRRTAKATDEYLARLASLQTGQRVKPVGSVGVSRLRGDTSHPQVYGRLANNYRFLIFRGMEPEAAQLRIVKRAEIVAETDATLAMRAQSQAFMQEYAEDGDGILRIVTGYRRVIHPELSRKTGVCALCLIAADRIYNVEQLLPIHDGCNCGVAEVFAHHDPGHQLNAKDLAAVYKAAGSNRAADLRKVRIRETDHGELGAILQYASDTYRDAEQADADLRAAA